MNFVNNWQRAAVLAAGATTLALDLPNGEYRLTVADSASAPTRWEIVLATVVDGAGTLTRAQEGTTDQNWPSGSVVYCAFTAQQLSSIFAQLTSLAARVSALEPPPAAVTWDSAKMRGPLERSSDGLTLTLTDEEVEGFFTFGACIATRPLVGKCYFEVSVSAPSLEYSPANLGIAPSDFDQFEPEVLMLVLNGGAGYILNNLVLGDTSFGSGEGFLAGDVVRMAVDMDALKIWFAVNDHAWLGGGDPATGATPSITFNGDKPLYPFAWVDGVESAVQARFDSADWLHAAPSGFTAIPLA